MADVHFVVGQAGRTERLPGHRVRLTHQPVKSQWWGGNEQTSYLPQCPPYQMSGKKKPISLFASCNGTKVFVLRFCNHVSSGDTPQLFMQMRQEDRGAGRQRGMSSSAVTRWERQQAFVSAATQLFTANAAITRLLIKRSQSDAITAIRQPCIQLPIARISNMFFFF